MEPNSLGLFLLVQEVTGDRVLPQLFELEIRVLEGSLGDAQERRLCEALGDTAAARPDLPTFLRRCVGRPIRLAWRAFLALSRKAGDGPGRGVWRPSPTRPRGPAATRSPAARSTTFSTFRS